jgi:hypothetical protein
MTFATRLLLWLVLLSGIFTANAAAAAAKKTSPPATRGTVVSVDPAGKTVTIEAAPGAAPQKCVLNDFSTVEINNKSVTIKQIKAGLWIRSVRLDSSSPPVVEDLDLITARG